MQTVILVWLTRYSYIGLFSLLVLGIVGVPFPDEVLLIFVGSLVKNGDLRLLPTIMVAWFGSLCGITLSYGIGRVVGFSLLHKYGHVVHLTPDRIEQMRPWMERWGAWGLLFGYFLPGVRHVTAYMAGTTRLSLRVFVCFAYTGALVWSGTFVIIGYCVGKKWQQFSAAIHQHLLFAAVLLIVLGISYLLVQRKLRCTAS